MLLFGHVGATLAFTNLIDKFTGKFYKDETKQFIDYRLIIFGSMLPDIIDKPLVLILSDKPVGSARFIAHSLIFIIILLIVGLFNLLKYKKEDIILMAFASMAHMIEDLVWMNPKIFFWPYYNLMLANADRTIPTMQRVDINKHVQIITKSVSQLNMKKVLQEPSVLIPEVIGGMIVIYFLGKLIANRKLVHFLKTGEIKKVES